MTAPCLHSTEGFVYIDQCQIKPSVIFGVQSLTWLLLKRLFTPDMLPWYRISWRCFGHSAAAGGNARIKEDNYSTFVAVANMPLCLDLLSVNQVWVAFIPRHLLIDSPSSWDTLHRHTCVCVCVCARAYIWRLSLYIDARVCVRVCVCGYVHKHIYKYPHTQSCS